MCVVAGEKLLFQHVNARLINEELGGCCVDPPPSLESHVGLFKSESLN